MELVHCSPLRPRDIDEKWFSVQEIHTLVTLLHAEGESGDALLKAARLSERDLTNPHRLVSARQRILAYRFARERSHDPCIALRCGVETRLAAYGIWGYALMCCGSLAEVLDFGFRYLKLAGPLMQKSLYLTPEHVIFRAEDSLMLSELFPFALEIWWSSIYSAMAGVLGKPLSLSSISVAYPAPAHHREYENIFGCPAVFGSSHCDMVFSRAYLDEQPLQANTMTAELCEELCSQLLCNLDASSDLAAAIRNLLLRSTKHYPSLDIVAAKMHMSPRTLRRKLKLEGTSFQRILAETRASLAKEYLATTNMSLAQVAELVGFSDPANFQSAFKKWVKQTPAQFRRHHLGFASQ